MKTIILFFVLLIQINYSQPLKSIKLDGNNISTLFWNSGIFNQNLSSSNTAAFEWPKGTGKTAIYSTGLCIAGYLNDSLRMSQASYIGEFMPGYCVNREYHTDSRFKFYKIKKGDNYINNPDWLNWGLMVPFGAPFNDVNHNGNYDYFVDTPGVKSSSQTIFICLTDADSNSHKIGEGFGGGTKPLYNEVHLTAWCYDAPGYEDMQFINWEVINKSNSMWDSVLFTIHSDPDLGFADDDYIGCDTLRNLSYCYNGDNEDIGGAGYYGLNPPAVGIAFLNCNNPYQRLIASLYTAHTSTPGPACEKEANGEGTAAYTFMKGLKRDRTPWVIPNTNPPQTTKFCYSGDPSGTGWTEFKGSVQNCGGSLIGTIIPVNPVGDRRSLMTFGSEYVKMDPNDTMVITAVQLIARGNNNLNSVTRLKELTDKARELCQNGFVIGINQISSEIPKTYILYQNYPNPFNPVTKIKFSIPKSGLVTIKIYDALGREVSTLVNDRVIAGVYSVEWNASTFPSGIYFYSINAGEYSQTRKLVLVK